MAICEGWCKPRDTAMRFARVVDTEFLICDNSLTALCEICFSIIRITHADDWEEITKEEYEVLMVMEI